MVKALVTSSDLLAQDQSGRSALHLACDRDRIEIILILLDYGASPSAVNHRQETLLR